MDNSFLALSVAGVVAPWFIELLKALVGSDLKGLKALTFTVVVSILISLGVLWYEKALNFNDPVALFASVGLVLGVSSTIYQYLQKQVQAPVAKIVSFLPSK